MKEEKTEEKSAIYGESRKNKGIHDLLVAWNKLNPKSWTLTIVGPWDRDLDALKHSVGKNNSINAVGPVYGESRFKFYMMQCLYFTILW